MIKHALRALLFLIALPIFVYGRLGETEQELVARFGPPISKLNESTLTQGKVVEFGSKIGFRQGEWTIESVLIEGRCAKEVYSKVGDWTDDQIRAVLTSNSQGEGWADVSKDSTKWLVREWHRTDGAVALWQKGVGMTVIHSAYDRAKQKAEAKAKADASRIPKI